MNAQSVCNDKTTLINDLITDSKIDFLLITESRLKPVGSERDIKALTPPGFKLISFPRPTRGGGVCLIHRDSMTFKCVPLPRFKSFEGYEFRIQLPSRSIVFVGIYRPPPSTKKKLTIPMFMDRVARENLYQNFLPSPQISDHNNFTFILETCLHFLPFLRFKCVDIDLYPLL